MGNLVNTGLGGSRKKKEADKELYFRPDLLIPGDGMQFTYIDLNTKEELEGVMQDADGRIMYPQASQTKVGLKVSASGDGGDAAALATLSGVLAGQISDLADSISGYTGTVSGTYTLNIVNGIIVSVE